MAQVFYNVEIVQWNNRGGARELARIHMLGHVITREI